MLPNISFLEALPIFGFLLFTLYLVILIKTSRKQDLHPPKMRLLPDLFWVCLAFCFLLFFLLGISPFYVSRPIYFFVIFAVTGCFILSTLVLPIRFSKRDAIALFALTVLLGLSMMISYGLIAGVVIGERTPAVYYMLSQGRWVSNNQLLNPYYEMFPVDIGLMGIFSEVTSMGYVSSVLYMIISIAATTAFMLTVFKLVTLVGGSFKEGVLSMLMSATVPILSYIWVDPPYLSLLFLTVILYFIVKFVKGTQIGTSQTTTLLFLFIVSFVAVLTHAIPGAALIIMYVLVILLGATKIVKGQDWKKLTGVLTATTVISVVIWLYTEASVTITSYGQGIVSSLLQYLVGPKSTSSSGYTSLYSQSVPAYYAYGWATPVAFAAAFLIWQILFKSRATSDGGLNILSLFALAGLGLMVLGFLVAFVFPGPGIQDRLTLPAFLLIVPALSEALSHLSRKSILVSILLLCLVGSSLPINMFNPDKSPDLWSFTYSATTANTQDTVESRRITTWLQNNSAIIGTSTLMYAIGLQVFQNGLSLSGSELNAKDVRAIIDSITMGENTSYEGLLVTPPETSQIRPGVGIIYDSGRNIIYNVR